MKIICIGRNYADHIAELNNTAPTVPLFFMKPETAVIRAGLPFFIPDFSQNVHYELELVLRICKVGKHIQPRFAHTYYKEIGLGIDFTARDIQRECQKLGHPWEIAKAFDGSAAISDMVPVESLRQPHDIRFSLKKNGTTVQQSSSVYMIHPFDALIAHVSKYVTLKIGDLIFTGTPAGVGPVEPGDQLEGYLEDTKMLTIAVK
ncbi:MAG: fumarylacetoacetate hydrolase family protein [Bacteroidales bacterium]|nr:fumarylacetoacetate hydrolase family protein [Bacteroidales bacterium]